MNAFRFREVSLVPQYAMSALEPDAEDRPHHHRPACVEGRVVRGDPARIDPATSPRAALDPDVLDRYPIELSGGMKQRVTMVLATLMNPSLLVADEITSALDVSTQKAVSEMLVEFRARSFVKSMLVITHDISVLTQIADSIIVMYAGKLAEKASAETIVDSPLHPYTQLLISSLPEVGVTYERDRLSGIPGTPPGPARPAAGLPLPRPLSARDSRSASRSLRSSRSSPITGPPAGGSTDAQAGERLEGLQGRRVRLEAHPALTDFSLEIKPGEVVSLIGESGSGKTTVGRMILGLLPVTDRLDLVRRRGDLDAPRRAAAALLQARPGRLPGSVQLVQPGLQGRSHLHDDQARVPARA